MSKRVAPKKEEPTPNLPAVQQDNGAMVAIPEEFAAMYVEDRAKFTIDDMVVPYLRVLQPLSPEVQEGGDEQIDGAKAGMFFNTATQELFDGREIGVRLVIVDYKRSVTEWKPRSAGGGFVADHGDNLAVLDRLGPKDAQGKRYTRDGTELIDSAMYYALVIREDGTVDQVCFVLSSTQWRAARQLNTKIQNLRMTLPDGRIIQGPAMYAGVWNFTTVLDKNEKGTWYRLDAPELAGFTHQLPNGVEVLRHAIAFRERVASGKARANAEALRGEEDGASRQPRQQGTTDDDIPF